MKIEYYARFKKNYIKRIQENPKLQNQFIKRLHIFSQNPMHPLLKNHALGGSMKGLRSFSITGDIRVIYQWANEKKTRIKLYDIGSHNQVY